MRSRVVTLVAVGVLFLAFPAGRAAASGTGSTIFQRFWDSMLTTWSNRTESQTPVWLSFIEQGERVFLGDTADVTELPAVQDAMAATRAVGGILLALCAVLSLGELTVSQMTGGVYTLGAWLWRLVVASVMTFGSLPICSAIVRFCNYLLNEVRAYLDRHFTAGTPELWEGLVGLLGGDSAHILLILVFLAILGVILLCMWFLYGGIRTAEVIIYMLLWPLTWPLYLLPSLEDIPKAASRAFVMWSALPIMVVMMLRTSIRLVVGGTLWGTVWAFIPAICLLGMTLFLPSAVRQVFGQGHAGTGVVQTADRMLMGLKLAAVAGAAGAAAMAPAPAGGAAAAAGTAMRAVPHLPGPGLQPMSDAAFSVMPEAGGTDLAPIHPQLHPPAQNLPAVPSGRSPDDAALIMRRDPEQRMWFPRALWWPDGHVARLDSPGDFPVVHETSPEGDDT